QGQNYSQAEKLGGLCYGEIMAEQWGAPSREADFFDAKADIEALFWPVPVEFDAGPHPALHPGRSARIRVGGAVAGWLGALHPRWQQKYELSKPAVLFEIGVEHLARRELPAAGEISRFPPVRRDISGEVDERVPVQAILDSLRAGSPPIVTDIGVFDLYRGEGAGPGKKSLAFRVLLQDTKRTLTDAEVDAVIAQLRKILEVQYQAKLRV
ncbi:MAG: phenylalanine--tRNA ligase subunit beta, partial [candidate division Zixibacteria bacterium]|nr:phenylalanine--tRNA ligase subunit beta [candidate division Zixibacteria bacterium]